MNESLQHFGVLGMKWGVRKKRVGSRTESFTIKKGSSIYRTATKDSEANKGHAFVSIDPKDAIGYARRGSMFNQAAFNMTFKVTKDGVLEKIKNLKEEPKENKIEPKLKPVLNNYKKKPKTLKN